ncbi:MAG TPA: DUF1080 domain-containing protein [Chitinophagaceae bacterium]|nr:DUF1080 domain-containing protein [Chitinophagaceae bacterium]
MIKNLLPAFCIFFPLLIPAIQSDPGQINMKNSWQSLLDKELSNWDVFIGIPEPGVDVPGYSEENRQKKLPLGLNNDPLHVFNMEEENGQPILHVSGQILGGLSTKKEYQNYHLKFKFKWGKLKYAPRLNQKRDNGILYHATGPHGKFWNVWMRSHEMQIQETDMGDYFGLAGVAMNIKSKKLENNQFIYAPDGEFNSFMAGQGLVNRCRRSTDYEKAYGEWNELELICFEDKSVHIVNGRVVMALQDSRVHIAENDEPSLQRGKIQLQSEYAEAYYKDIQIQLIKNLPKQYAKYFFLF